MAIMIPETIPSTASQGEKKLFAILYERLDNTFLVWHNPKIQGLEADFVILSPTFGLLIIEVKGYFYSSIKSASRDFLRIERVKKFLTWLLCKKKLLLGVISAMDKKLGLIGGLPLRMHG